MTKQTVVCHDQEHLHYLDDMGNVYCDLMREEWNEDYGGYCDFCEFARLADVDDEEEAGEE